MNEIVDIIKRQSEYAGIIKTIGEERGAPSPHPLLVNGLCEGAADAFFVAAAEEIFEKYKEPVLIVVPDEKQAKALYESFLQNGVAAALFPYRDFNYYRITASHEYERERLSALFALETGTLAAVIATPDAALQYTVPKEILSQNSLEISDEKRYQPDEIVSLLLSAGYARADMVDGVGQFSLRGGILDVFSPAAEYPVRIEFFDDEIDSMALFDILSQRRLDSCGSYTVIPAREVIVSGEKRDELAKYLTSRMKKTGDKSLKEELAREIDEIKNGQEITFIDKYICRVYPQKETLCDRFSGKTYIAAEYNRVFDRIRGYEERQKGDINELLQAGLPDSCASFGKYGADFEYFLDKNAGAIVNLLPAGMGGKKLSAVFSFTTRHTAQYFGNFDLLLDDLSFYIRNKYRVILLTDTAAEAKSLSAMLYERGVFATVGGGEGITIESDPSLPGFELTNSRFACLSLRKSGASSNATFRGGRIKKKKAARERIMSYADLRVGDYVVHEAHGIGQYLGLQTLTLDGITRDFVKVKYLDKDVLYLPCDRLDMLSKYIGAKSEDGTVRLSKMGGGDWIKAKSRAKGAAKDMAKELIALYAERLRREGFACSADDEMQREFESEFEFEETDGQLASVKEIKADMEAPYPMDRLLCGDVGFGKTEVALRAAFKAVLNSKQVAVLVPTTILAMQHYQTMLSRMRGFPVRIEMLSRFRTAGEQKQTVRRLRRGETDIVVGTHRIVSSDIEFKDLGLVIIDEEQRFGVAQKEKLKQLSKTADVLTLTATPIPRTLNMAMSGIRDISILEEAPGDRLPVQTYVLEYDNNIISDAINRELRRGGQVFYLYNRVDTIHYVEQRVTKMAPDARIAVAHGKMDKEQLSDIWHSLVLGEIDILISTTIIETGLDIPNANTLIIENADCMGLAQLHQIRGRVGRSSRRAYAYFTYRAGKGLSEEAEKRLSAIRDYTEFGSGFKIALRDLEIRGAGNVLGAEQHGHIASVGYDLYMKILNSAILEEQGKSEVPKPECTVDLKFSAFLPGDYIPSPAQRIDMYKKIAAIENSDDCRDILDELCDRYGEPDKKVTNLVSVSYIHALGCAMNITKIAQTEASILIYPEKIDFEAWTAAAAAFKGSILINASSRPYISYRVRRGEQPLSALTAILEKVKSHSEGENK